MKLYTKDLVKVYKTRTVVDHVSIEVEQGEIVGLLGPNGAGKTTTFYMVVGLIKPNEGRIFLDDTELTKLPERTVIRIFSGDTDNPYVDTLHRIVVVLGGSLDDIFADSKVVVGDTNLVKLQENVDVVTAECDLLKAQNKVLNDKITALTSENELLKLQLAHKDEIIALHNYYNKLKQN